MIFRIFLLNLLSKSTYGALQDKIAKVVCSFEINFAYRSNYVYGYEQHLKDVSLAQFVLVHLVHSV